MSKADDKQKIYIDTPIPKQQRISKHQQQPSASRQSIFGRLGNKHQKSADGSTNIKVVESRMKHHSSSGKSSGHHHRLDDADPDLLEQKRAELKKELELQLKMESAARKPKSSAAGIKSAAEIAARKRKQMARRSSSSSSSSSSGSDSSSDSSSSDSGAARRTGKARKNVKTKRHQSSSSSGDEDPRRKLKVVASSSGATKAKRVCHKKLDASGKVKSHHTKKTVLDKPNLIVHRKRTPSPSQILVRKHQRPTSPGSVIKSSSSKLSSKVYADQHHRMKEHGQSMPGAGPSALPGHHRGGDKEREFQMREREREREREHQLHLRSRERLRSRSPPPMQQVKQMRMKSRSPPGGFKRLSRPRDVKQRSPPPSSNVSSQRRASSKTRSGGGGSVISGIRRGDRTPERIIIKKDVSGGKRHESSREREHRRERDQRERESAAMREKDRLEMIRLQEQRRERERLDQDRLRVKVIDPRDREIDQRVGKSERLLPRPAERAMALAAARDQGRDKSEERSVPDMHHRPRSHSHSRSNRDRNDPYADRAYDRTDDRYDSHRRPDMDRSSAGLVRDDRSDRGGGGDRDRDYVAVRRREDSRGRIVEENIILDPYAPRDKVRGPISERDRSIEREREHRYGSERERDQRLHGDGGSRYDEGGGRSVDERRGRGGSERGHDYGRPSSRGGGYIDEPPRGPSHRAPPESQHRERGGPERESWYRGPDEPSSSRGDDRAHVHHYDRHSGRDWDHNERSGGNHRQPSAGRVDYPMDEGRRDGNANPDWSSANERPWSDGRGLDRGHGSERGGGGGSHHGDRGHTGDRPNNWHHNERGVENWDGPEEFGPGEFHRGGHGGEKGHHDVEPMVHGIGSGNRGGLGNRRWPNWRGGRGGGRGGGGNEHHIPQGNNLFRRQNQMHNNQQDGFQDHHGDHPFRRQPGQSGEYQQTHHHGHNAFSTSIVRPLLSLPPLKPPIMDDGLPMSMLPTLGQKKLLPHLNNPLVVGGIIKHEDPLVAAPLKPMVVAEPVIVQEEKKLTVKTEGTTKETGGAPSANEEGAVPEKDGGEDGEEDALSEISDDADEILNRQEQEAAAAALLAASAVAVPPTAPLQKPALLPTPPFKVGEFPRLLVNQPFAINLLPMAPFDDHHLHHMHHHHHHPNNNAMLIKPPAVLPNIANSDLHAEPNADDLDLDFEEISDGELEEEARIRGLGDALGVDWASLVEESKAKANEQRSNVFASAKQRWQPHRILLDVGVSFRMAGKDFASTVLNAAHRKLTAEEAEAKQRLEAAATKQKVEEQAEFTIKKEVHDEDEYGENAAPPPTEPVAFSVKHSEETGEMGEEEPPQAELLIHPIACVQVASRVNAEIRKNMVFGMTGPFSRALSAQKDVQMRRQLCGLSMKACGGGPLKTGRPVGGVDYAAMARQLFEKALAKVN